MEFNYTNLNNFNSFVPQIVPNSIPKIINISEEERSPKSLFFKIFDDKIIDLLIKTSNNYMKKYIPEKYDIKEENISDIKFDHNHNNTYEQIYIKLGGIDKFIIIKFLIALIFMGLHTLSNYENYWKDDFINKKNLPKIITKNKFKLICFALHLPVNYDDFNEINNNDNEEENENFGNNEEEIDDEIINENDPRKKVFYYINSIINNSQKYFILSRDLTIDESMLFFRGRCKMRFYMPHKPSKLGFKIHCLVDSKTDYLYDAIIDPGKNNKNFIITNPEYSYTESIVLKLLSKHENKGYRLFFDSSIHPYIL